MKYKVIIRRVITQDATLTVDAPNADTAKKIALTRAQDGTDEGIWSATDGEYVVDEVSIEGVHR